MLPDLIRRSQSELKAADFGMSDSDPYTLLLSAFHIGQAIERALKAIIEYHGRVYEKTHELQTLIQAIPELPDILGDSYVTLITWASELSTWEYKTRYDKDYLLSKDVVDRAYALAVDIVSKASSHVAASAGANGIPNAVVKIQTALAVMGVNIPLDFIFAHGGDFSYSYIPDIIMEWEEVCTPK